jgi:hypothetical protein
MAMQVHLNGEARIRTGTGAANALEDWGVSVNGVNMTFDPMTEDVITDTFGPMVPFDFQQFLETATIEIEFVFYDSGVWQRSISRTLANAARGTMPAAGTLLGQGGFLFRLLVNSPTDGDPYNFLACKIEQGMSVPVGTRRTMPKVTCKAIPYTGLAGTSAGAVLYNQVTT